jgi:hypothetical protein
MWRVSVCRTDAVAVSVVMIAQQRCSSTALFGCSCKHDIALW